mmetsp:Transcript_7034/g.21864  ORF Transcript_7034/g.21864 Transcript_7034/m.21864 type:complete len:349 (+) Transcript_7034:123-1169(+)
MPSFFFAFAIMLLRRSFALVCFSFDLDACNAFFTPLSPASLAFFAISSRFAFISNRSRFPGLPFFFATTTFAGSSSLLFFSSSFPFFSVFVFFFFFVVFSFPLSLKGAFFSPPSPLLLVSLILIPAFCLRIDCICLRPTFSFVFFFVLFRASFSSSSSSSAFPSSFASFLLSLSSSSLASSSSLLFRFIRILANRSECVSVSSSFVPNVRLLDAGMKYTLSFFLSSSSGNEATRFSCLFDRSCSRFAFSDKTRPCLSQTVHFNATNDDDFLLSFSFSVSLSSSDSSLSSFSSSECILLPAALVSSDSDSEDESKSTIPPMLSMLPSLSLSSSEELLLFSSPLGLNPSP